MKVTSDSSFLPSGEGEETARRLVQDDGLEATEMRLEVDDHTFRFEDVRGGFSMLYREDLTTGAIFVALDTYNRDRVNSLVRLFERDPENAIASIEWQEDSDTGFFGYITIAVSIAISGAALYGLYVEFFQ